MTILKIFTTNIKFLNNFRLIDEPTILLTIVGFQTPRYMQELSSDTKYLQEILSSKESYVFSNYIFMSVIGVV